MTTPARQPMTQQTQKPTTEGRAKPKPPSNPYTGAHVGKKQRQQSHADTNAVLRQRNKK